MCFYPSMTSLRLALESGDRRLDPCLSTGHQMEAELLPCTKAALDVISDDLAKDGSMWVIHYSKNIRRRQLLEDIFKKNNLAANWLDTFDRQEVSKDTCDCIFTPNYQSSKNAVRYGAANAYSQNAVYYHMVKHNISHSMLMEDDPAWSPHVETHLAEELEDIMQKSKELGGFDTIHFGGCGKTHGVKTDPNSRFGTGPKSRCTNGYIISQEGAKKMLAVLRSNPAGPKIYDNPDWMLERIGKKAQPGCSPLRVFMLEPPLFDNGGKHKKGKTLTKGEYVGPMKKTFTKVEFN